MFLKTVGEPTRLKHAVYLAAAVILGLLLALLAHAAIEISYLKLLASQGKVAVFYGACALPPVLQAALWLSGAVGGLFLGRAWWRYIYVDRRWEKKHAPLEISRGSKF